MRPVFIHQEFPLQQWHQSQPIHPKHIQMRANKVKNFAIALETTVSK